MDNNQTDESSNNIESIDKFKERINKLSPENRNLEIEKMLNKIKDTRNKSKVEKIKKQCNMETTNTVIIWISFMFIIIIGCLFIVLSTFFNDFNFVLLTSICVITPIIIISLLLLNVLKPPKIIECPRCKTILKTYKSKYVQCRICCKNIMLKEN